MAVLHYARFLALRASTLGEGVEGDEYAGSGSLFPLPAVLHHGLSVITFFSFLSFVSSISLLGYLCFRLIRWRRKSPQAYNQFIILIMNLLFADIQQSMAFLLNVQWVTGNGINVHSPTCRIQGWFVSTGDLASGVWCLTIGVHTAASVLFNKRLSKMAFYIVIISLWIFVYGCAIVGLAMHRHLYVRAGAWCWVNEKYSNVRLYLHYLWIFIAELVTIIIYSVTYIILLRRIKAGYFASPAAASRARDVAKLMAAYPLVYVICTLPLASARTAAMAGKNVPIICLIFAGAMITSNGWLDCLLYTLTRRILIFSDDPPSEDCGLATFAVPWSTVSRFGTTTTITAGCNDLASQKGSIRSRFGLSRKASLVSWRSSTSSTAPIYATGGGNISQNTGAWDTSQGDVMGGFVVVPSMEAKKEITFTVTHEVVQMEDIRELQEFRARNERRATQPLSPEDMDLDFESKPAGI